jgi:hypothetical protein
VIVGAFDVDSAKRGVQVETANTELRDGMISRRRSGATAGD